MSDLLSTLRKIRKCEGETAAQVVFEHYLKNERTRLKAELLAEVEKIDTRFGLPDGDLINRHEVLEAIERLYG